MRMEQSTQSLDTFYQLLDTAGPNSWGTDSEDEQFARLVQQGQALCGSLLRYGDEKALLFIQEKPEPVLADYLFFYEWLQAAKQFLILWRNTTFGYLQAQLLVADSNLEAASFQQWQSDAANQLQEAAQALGQIIPEREAEFNTKPKEARKQMEAWGHQTLPWTVYKEQITMISSQLDDLKANQKALYANCKQLRQLRETIFNNIHQGLDELQTLQEIARSTITFIDETGVDSPGRIPIYLENQEQQLPPVDYSKVFKKQLEKGLEGLSGEMQVPVAAQGPVLKVKDVDFRRFISRWLESEVLPLLYEIWEVSTNIRNNLKMALINIRNRAILLNNENAENGERSNLSDDLNQPLHSFIQQTDDRIIEIEQLHELIHHRMDENFKLSSVFREREFFLSVPLQSTLNQFRNNQNQLLQRVQRWGDRQRRRVQRWLTDVQTEDAMSISEKVVRFVDTRRVNPDNHAYTSIFLTSGYIGESFWVGRKSELRRVAQVVNKWKQGYRGTILLTGDRFCGKSLFGDLVSNRYFPSQTIRLSPNSTVQFQGRTFTTSYDLEEALNFVSKYRFDQPPLIWLDDLELWHSEDFPISRNVQRLGQHIDRNSTRIFYLVAAGNVLRQQLELNRNFSRHFQATIALNSMNQEDTYQAILIRHGATHKELVNENGLRVEATDFQQQVNRIHRTANGNIGEALSLWAVSIRALDEDNVIQNRSPFYGLPNFLDADQAVLLRTIMLEKRTNEYRLRKRFGPAFNPRYAEALLRLLSVGLLRRHIDGWLEISDVAVNSITRQLRTKQYIS
ncbi:MAG: hypothetical protein AAFP77_23075 [Bacteroidota bacterium]